MDGSVLGQLGGTSGAPRGEVSGTGRRALAGGRMRAARSAHGEGRRSFRIEMCSPIGVQTPRNRTRTRDRRCSSKSSPAC